MSERALFVVVFYAVLTLGGALYGWMVTYDDSDVLPSASSECVCEDQS